MATLFRIATVKATQKKYLVSYIDFRANKVVCWGEVTKRLGLRTWHDKTKSFPLADVEVSPEQPKTAALLEQLTEQMFETLREEGNDVDVRRTRRGNTRYTVTPKAK